MIVFIIRWCVLTLALCRLSPLVGGGYGLFLKLRSKRNINNPEITVLAFNYGRFRGELEALENTGRAIVHRVPFAVLSRLHTSLLGHEIRRLSFYAGVSLDGTEQRLQRRFEYAVSGLMRGLAKVLSVDMTISAALHYRHDLPFGAVSEKIGVPFVVCHRECLHAAKRIRRVNIERWAGVGNLKLSHIIVQNEASRQTFIEAGIVKPGNISAEGNPRMDDFVRKALLGNYFESNPASIRQPTILLFSFFHGNGFGEAVPKWTDGSTQGYMKLFDNVHAVFGQLAKAHPEYRFVIKTKWAAEWFDNVRRAILKAGIDPSCLPNLELTCSGDPHDLMDSAEVVSGFGSTTILEAGLAGKKVIVPFFDEAAMPSYADDVMLTDAYKSFTVAYNKDDYASMIMSLCSAPPVSEDVWQKRREEFSYWVSPVGVPAADLWINKMIEVRNARQLKGN